MKLGIAATTFARHAPKHVRVIQGPRNSIYCAALSIHSNTAESRFRPSDFVAISRQGTSGPFRLFSSGEEHSFQAETRQLLDIVTNSLYTDKEVSGGCSQALSQAYALCASS
jgi:hypothetical protein